MEFVDMDVYSTKRSVVAVRTPSGVVTALVERHGSGLVFISDAGGAGMLPTAARKTIENAIRTALGAAPAAAHGGVTYLARGPVIEVGASFCKSIARGIDAGVCAFAVE